MNKLMGSILKLLMLISVVCLAVATYHPQVVKAAEISLDYPIMLVEEYSISGDKVVPGNDFTLSLILKNYSDVKDANDVWVNISCPDGIAPVYGSVAQMYVGNIKAGETKEIAIEFEALKDITQELLDFHVGIMCNETSNSCLLRVPVGSDAPFSIISSYIPTQVYQNDMVDMVLNFYVLGDENVRNVSVSVLLDGEEIAESPIGIVTAGTTKTQNMTFSTNETGTHDVRIILNYADETGMMQEFLATEGKLIISTKIDQHDGSGVTDSETGNNADGEWSGNPISKTALLGISGILILLLCLVIVVILRKNK